ncbi:unnamed protein product [Adineta steineri]|uniref:SH3 domain-containing protein n=1 Tax=Adineta steineri TaxID=433720 RepID=A0A813TNH6_9BILA|nr:unnamed protein product [Adineta steineri]
MKNFVIFQKNFYFKHLLYNILNISTRGRTVPYQCQVLYDYTPQNPDELEIHVGDIINIIEMCDDGWYCGMMEKENQGETMEFGTFPGNYVKLLPS